MTWTYSGNPATSLRDTVRFLIQDTEETLQLQSDEELDFLIQVWMPKYESYYLVASKAATVISHKFAGVMNISADGVSVNTADLSDRYAKMASKLRVEHQEAGVTGGVLDLANLMSDSRLDYGIKPLSFGIGQFDNPAAGQQDYGGISTSHHELSGGYGQP